MPITNKELLTRLEVALKQITDVTALGESVLQPVKFAQFVRQMQEETVILPEARFIEMDAQQVDIDRIAFIGRILRSGTDVVGDHRILPESEWAQPTTATNKLIAQELQAIVSLRDKALRRNIERGDFEDTLINLFGEAAGRDLEEYAMLANTELDPNFDLELTLTDGWAVGSANKVYGVESAPGEDDEDFDETAADWPETLLEAMLSALPKQYIVDRSDWRFWVPYEIENALRDLYKARGTALGDTALTTAQELMYKGIPVRFAQLLERSQAPDINGGTNDAGDGRICMLGHPENMAWGVFHQVNIEPEREAKDRRTDFVLSFEGDADFEDENAHVTAYLDIPQGFYDGP